LSRFAVTIVVLVLVAATTAAFAVAERLKLERSPITVPNRDGAYTREFSPVCDCDQATARLRLRFRRDEIVTAVIVDARDRPVRTLDEATFVDRGDHTFEWDGRDDAGKVVPDARYRLRLRFERERRSILVQPTIRVDTKPPRLRGVTFAPDAISPDGDRRGDRFSVFYRASEEAKAELVVDGQVVVKTLYRARRTTYRLNWHGCFEDCDSAEPVLVKRGEHEVRLLVHDLAGNVATETFTLRVRFIELDQSAYEVALGDVLRFAVDTDAETYRWFLFRPHGGKLGRPVLYDEEATDREVGVRIPRDARPGTYVLRVAEAGKRARANVTVTP
jgi:hypothetical protein